MKFSGRDTGTQKAVTAMFAAYGKQDDGQRMAVYVSMLGDIQVGLLNKAIKKLILESKFLPTVSEIVQAAKSLVGEIHEDQREKSWGEAWAEILKQVHDVFMYGTPHFSTPEIATAVKCYGWRELCIMRTDEMQTASAQMRRFYEDACRRKREKLVNRFVLKIDSTMLINGPELKKIE